MRQDEQAPTSPSRAANNAGPGPGVPHLRALEALPADVTQLPAHWHLAFERTRRGISISNPRTGRLEAVNPAFAAMHGGVPSDFVGQPISFVCTAEALDRIPERESVARSEGFVHYETEHVRLDGTRFPALCEIVVATDERGDTLHRIAYLEDLSDRRAAEQQSARSTQLFERAFADAPIGMAIVGVDGTWMRVNAAVCELLGYSEDQLRGTSFKSLTHPDDLAPDLRCAEQLLAGEIQDYQLEKRYRHADGRWIWVLLSVSIVRGEGSEPDVFVSQIVDVSRRKHDEGELRRLANTDPLTGMWNRWRFEAELASAVEDCRNGERCGALLLIDVDGFKHVNDSFGHAAGDALLIEVSRRLGERVRDTDAVGRVAGDEFGVLLPSVQPHQALAAAHALCEHITATPIVIDDEHAITPTVSIGATMIDGRTRAPADVFVAADIAMYDAKDLGRNRAVMYGENEARHARMSSDLLWSQRIRHALTEGRFTLYAQPIVDLETGVAFKHEVLLRMLDDDGSAIPPGAFLPAAERFRLIGELDLWVVGEATRLAAAYPEAVLSINLSGSSVTDPDLVGRIEAMITSAGCRGDQLVFEITETEAIASMDQAEHLSGRLAQLGCRLALDDFGAGFASFYHLKALPLEFIKLDGEFIRHLPVSADDLLVVQAVQGVAVGMGRTVIAEQIEDRATAEVLLRLGVRYGQGYHFARPAPAYEVLAAYRDGGTPVMLPTP
ncbi:MAG: EAL domain-containing protein [Solirubrobacteraceae bacterium]|nr:EAL domain-containing protein [Solirubrobacteraceae bacterium]